MHHHAFGFKYQVTCSLGKPFRLISFEGPFSGSASDVTIFRDTIAPHLIENERVMCDKGYYQDERCWCPPTGDQSSLTDAEKLAKRKVTRIRQLNERLNGRLKGWGFFRKKWRYGLTRHRLCASVCAKLTNLEVHAFPLT